MANLGDAVMMIDGLGAPPSIPPAAYKEAVAYGFDRTAGSRTPIAAQIRRARANGQNALDTQTLALRNAAKAERRAAELAQSVIGVQEAADNATAQGDVTQAASLRRTAAANAANRIEFLRRALTERAIAAKAAVQTGLAVQETMAREREAALRTEAERAANAGNGNRALEASKAADAMTQTADTAAAASAVLAATQVSVPVPPEVSVARQRELTRIAESPSTTAVTSPSARAAITGALFGLDANIRVQPDSVAPRAAELARDTLQRQKDALLPGKRNKAPNTGKATAASVLKRDVLIARAGINKQTERALQSKQANNRFKDIVRSTSKDVLSASRKALADKTGISDQLAEEIITRGAAVGAQEAAKAGAPATPGDVVPQTDAGPAPSVPAAQPSSGGSMWRNVAIGAAGLLAAGGAVILATSRRRDEKRG